MDNLYDYLHEKFKALGGTQIGSGLSAEFILLAFFPLVFIALLRGVNDTIAIVLALLSIIAVAFSAPFVVKISKENTDHYNIAAFYVAIVMGIVMFIMLGGI